MQKPFQVVTRQFGDKTSDNNFYRFLYGSVRSLNTLKSKSHHILDFAIYFDSCILQMPRGHQGQVGPDRPVDRFTGSLVLTFSGDISVGSVSLVILVDILTFLFLFCSAILFSFSVSDSRSCVVTPGISISSSLEELIVMTRL